MLETNTEQSFIAVLKLDVAQAVSLYFAPVRAVVREFNKAVSANGENGNGRSPRSGAEPA